MNPDRETKVFLTLCAIPGTLGWGIAAAINWRCALVFFVLSNIVCLGGWVALCLAFRGTPR